MVVTVAPMTIIVRNQSHPARTRAVRDIKNVMTPSQCWLRKAKSALSAWKTRTLSKAITHAITAITNTRVIIYLLSSVSCETTVSRQVTGVAPLPSFRINLFILYHTLPKKANLQKNPFCGIIKIGDL